MPGWRVFLKLWGGNGEERNKLFVFITAKWGHMGRKCVSPLEMEIEGGVRGIQDPQAEEIGRRLDRKTQPEYGNNRARRRSRIGTQPRAAVPHEFGSHRLECPVPCRRRGRLRSTTQLIFGSRRSSSQTWSLHRAKSEVRVNRFEGHRA